MEVSQSSQLDSGSLYTCDVDLHTGRSWDRIVGLFADGVIDQTWAYGSSCYGQENISTLAVQLDGHIVAACQILIIRAPLLPAGIAHVKFGPMWRRYGGVDNPEHLIQIFRFLKQEYAEKRGMCLRIMPAAELPENRTVSKMLARQRLTNHASEDPDRYIVNVSSDAESVRAALKSKWRYHLKKSEKEGLEVTCSEDQSHVTEFIRLYENMRTSKKFTDPRALGRLVQIAEALPENMRFKTWMCRHQGRAVASAITSEVGETCCYLFGASDADGRRLRAGYLLHWHIIKTLLSGECRWYDLGGSCGNAGLVQFKSGLVGKDQILHKLPGDFDVAGSAMSGVFATAVFGLRSCYGKVQERLATAA